MTTPQPNATTPIPRPGDPTDIGPIVSLPIGRILGATIAGCLVGGAFGWLMLLLLSPDHQVIAAYGAAGAIVAHLVVVVFERPWRKQRLGKWAFTILHGSVISLMAALASFGVLYSATRLSVAPLGLTTAGAWFIGNLAKVLAYGRFARAADAVPAGPTGVA